LVTSKSLDKLKFLLPILLKWGGDAALVRSTKSATEGSLADDGTVIASASDPSVIDAPYGLAMPPPHFSEIGRRENSIRDADDPSQRQDV
jgi:hypothetical protein